MLSFNDICTYRNNYDLIWDGRLTFPQEIPGATFIDGWVRVPRSEPAGSSVTYDLEQIYVLGGATYNDPTYTTRDWHKSGTAIVTADGFIEPLDTQLYRNAVATRFKTPPDSGPHLCADVRIRDYGSKTYWIAGALFKLRIGADNYALSNISESSNCMDEAITLSWIVSAQTVHAIEILNEQGVVVYQVSQSSVNPAQIIPAGTLDKGTYKIRVQSGYDLSSRLNNAGVGLKTPIQEAPLTIWRIEPKIIAFEPEGVAQNRQQPIAVTWASENQQIYVLKVKQGEQVVKEYSGTTATTATIPANTLQSGLTTLELTLKYIPTWGTEVDAVYTTKTISFEAYGTPETPVFTSGPTYDTAYPTITWTTTEQYYYRVRILFGETLIQDSGLVPSTVGSHLVKDPLPSGSYTVELTIQSEYNLTTSASQEATIAFAEPEAPTVSVMADSSRGTITVSLQANIGTNPTESLELFRREIGGSLIRIAKGLPTTSSYVDYAVTSETEYSYLSRAIGSKGGYKDSEPVTTSVLVPYTQLADANDRTSYIELRLEPNKQETAVRGTHLMTGAGCSAPRVEYSDEKYRTLDCSFFVPARDANRMIELYYSAALLLFRDNRGRKLFGCISSYPKIKDSAYGWAAVQFSFTELDHREAV